MADMALRFNNIKLSAPLEKQEGGYTESSVLAKLEAYDMLISLAKAPNAAAERISYEAERLRRLPLKRVKGGLFRKNGYSVEQVDKLIEELDSQIIAALKNK